ncbi:MAG: DNA helicase RecQ [Saprospiraceae bacterium]|nr:DNA helicase RecQ [Saprospiraceae bacterium]
MVQTEAIDLSAALQEYFGFNQFKGNQQAIVKSVLDGKDTFVIMPTGGGKSLCYQLPALLMEGTAIIISPLIALMKNQVDSIRGYSQEDNVAHFLNSSLNKGQIKKVKQDIIDGTTKLLYIAPETLTKDENLEFFQNTKVSFVAVDEAHCISEWGHDFRPEYRRIRNMIDIIGGEIPVIALTATATPKVRADIVKILNMKAENIFLSSFNRDNLFYEVRQKGKKEQTFKQILQLIKLQPNQSGIIYVQSRKAAEELAQVLSVNGIKSSPYHAGLDAKTRTKAQDDFLMEEIDVICATIAFGMGIDKPDVRFVIHYDMPKSIENYYQETGRAGRDGLEGNCIAFYSYADIARLEKFLRDKPVAEREMGSLLMQEVMAYAETTSCRRKFLLHYFGEHYNEASCDEKCDNCKYPKEKLEVKNDMQKVLKAVLELNENYDIKLLIDYVLGKASQKITEYGFDKLPGFGSGKDNDHLYWHSIFRNALLQDLMYKDIEQYGLLKLTQQGKEFVTKPKPIYISINRAFENVQPEEGEGGGSGVLDEDLMKMLKDLRKTIAKKHNVPPFVIFQDPSLEDMATQYPVTMDDMTRISGVSMGKAQKYAKNFIEMIAQYVEENEIDRPTEFIVKSVANKSKAKVEIIKSIDKKIPLEDIAKSSAISFEELLEELDAIVISGTKVNLDYYIDDAIDEYAREDIYQYFMESESDSVDVAFKELKDSDITLDEIKLVRIKFLSDVAN